jgi:predicted nucleic acid-binding protein
VDTNVLVAAMTSANGVNREVMRACLLGKAKPVFGELLFLEYEDVLARPRLSKSPSERSRAAETVVSVFKCLRVDGCLLWLAPELA